MLPTHTSFQLPISSGLNHTGFPIRPSSTHNLLIFNIFWDPPFLRPASRNLHITSGIPSLKSESALVNYLVGVVRLVCLTTNVVPFMQVILQWVLYLNLQTCAPP